MASQYLPIRAFNRSQNVRIGNQKVLPTTTTYIDVNDPKQRKEFSYHSAIGAVFVVGGLSASNSDIVFSGVEASGDGTDLKITTADGTLRNRQDGSVVAVQPATTTLSAADGTNPRIDIIEVKTADGSIKKVTGTAAVSPVAPALDAGYIAVASVAVAANATSVSNTNITDLRTL